MKSIYKVHWTENALKELSNTVYYLEQNFTLKELNKLAIEIEKIILIISKNPNTFKEINPNNNVRKIVILKYNTMFYRVKNESIEILSFFSNRQDLRKIKL